MEKRFETREIPALYARATVEKSSIDKENRTIWVTFATDKAVRMWDWEKGDYLEELSMEPTAVRMDRINTAGPVWDNHQYWEGTRGVIGRVVEGTAALEKGQARAQLRFGKKQAAQDIWSDIEDGIVTTVSVGYDVHKAEMTRQEGNLKVYRATDWEPFEVSIAPMPADIHAQMRTKQHKIEVEVEESEDTFQRDFDYIQTLQARYKNY